MSQRIAIYGSGIGKAPGRCFGENLSIRLSETQQTQHPQRPTH
jgi:hypothetical protein